jgi:hypothetical protein
VHDRSDALCDDDACHIRIAGPQVLLDPGFRGHIHCAGGIIHDQDLRVLQQRAGNADALFLSAGKTGTLRSEDGIVSVRKRADKRIGFRVPADRFQFLRLGYFCMDTKDSKPGNLVFNRSVSLKDSYKPENK